MGHDHHHAVEGKNLFLTILLNLSISIAELVGGLVSGSISLISDAIHNFSDVLSLIVSYVANRLTLKSTTNEQTFGYKRAEILAAFLNSTTLLLLAVGILYSAIVRFFNPIEVSSSLVIWLALLSIIVNALSVFFVKEDSHDNMNIKSAYLHLLGDMMTSIAVLIGGLVMKFYSIYWIDPLFSIIIALYLVSLSWDIFTSSLKIIMQFTPAHIDIEAIGQAVTEIAGVKNIHHVHVWQINEHDTMFEAHIDVENDITISEFAKIEQDIQTYLHETYEIHHTTLQPEFCKDDCKKLVQ